MDSGGWTVIEVSLLTPGSSLECDALRGNQVLLRQGTTITTDFLDSLKRQNIEFVKVTAAVAEHLKTERHKADLSGDHSDLPRRDFRRDDYALPSASFFEGTISEHERAI